MVGGKKEHYEKGLEILKGMGTNFFYCGEAGQGQVAKHVNNMILALTMVGVSEAFAIGEKLGADPKLLQQICAVSSARSWVMDTYHPSPGVMSGVPASRGYSGGFSVEMVRKDL